MTLCPPALFILSAKLLSTCLNVLFEDTTIREFGMPKWSSDLNHLPYADDTIIFVYVDEYSLNLVMNTLNEYEGISGQTINKEKSFFYMYNKVSGNIINQVSQITGFNRGQFPLLYLGCTSLMLEKGDLSIMIF